MAWAQTPAHFVPSLTLDVAQRFSCLKVPPAPNKARPAREQIRAAAPVRDLLRPSLEIHRESPAVIPGQPLHKSDLNISACSARRLPDWAQRPAGSPVPFACRLASDIQASPPAVGYADSSFVLQESFRSPPP